MRLVLYGYYGYGNAGDEAILAGMLHGLRQHAPNAEKVVLSGNPQQTASLHGVAARPRQHWPTLLDESQRADAWIFGGGSLLQDVSGPLTLPYYLTVIRFLSLRGQRMYIHGHGIGPLKSGWGAKATARALSRAQRLSVRDIESRSLLSTMGIAEEKIDLGADPAFLLPPPAPITTDNAGPLVAVALRPAPGQDYWLPAIVAALGDVASRTGARLLILPLHESVDRPLAEHVASALPRHASVTAAGLSFREQWQLLAACDMVVAMRLHAGILAAGAGVPGVLLAYDPKVAALGKQLGWVCLAPRQWRQGDLTRALYTTWQQRHAMARDLVPAVRQMKLRAEHDMYGLAVALATLVHEVHHEQG